MRSFLLLIIFFLSLSSAHAATVEKVLDADTVRMDDGQVVRLYGITAKPIQPQATAFLEQWARGKNLTLQPATVPRDRHGRTLAKLIDESGISAQAALVSAGMVRVYTLPDANAAIADELLPLESAARTAQRGQWNISFTIYSADNTTIPNNIYALVEGTVKNTATIKGTTYVNFGDDWKTDFALTMPAALGKQLGAAGWAGKTLCARGWVQDKNGPMIAVSHKEQIEIIN